MKIEILTENLDFVLENIFETEIDSIEIGTSKDTTNDSELVLLQGNEENLLGIPTCVLLLKLGAVKLGANTTAVICSLVAATLFEATKEAGKVVFNINKKKVERDKELLKEAIREVLEEQKD